jgi:Trp operon repressor
MAEFNDFIDLIYSIRDKELFEDFLLGLTTPSERKEFVQRVEIVKQLLAGKPQHDIAHELGVGVATVTRASKELSQGRFKVLRDKQ